MPLHRPVWDNLLRSLGVLVVVFVGIEAILAFRGPWAFTRKPSLVLAPLYSPTLDVEERMRVRETIEREITASRHYQLYARSFIDNWYADKEDRIDIFDGDLRSKDETVEWARELGMERVISGSAYRRTGSLNIYLTIIDVASGENVTRWSGETDSLDNFEKGVDGQGEPLNYAEELAVVVSGPSLANYLFLFWIGGLFILGALVVVGRFPTLLLEGLLIFGGLLHLFSYIYALNGDMPYVQRFVATSGVLDLADTATERATAAIRFLPLQITAFLVWGVDIARGIAVQRNGEKQRALIDRTALLFAVVSGLFFALALPSFLRLRGIPFLAWIATIPLYLAIRHSSTGRGIVYAVAFTGLNTLIINYWQGTFSYVSLPFTTLLTMVQFTPFLVLLVITVRRGGRFWWLLAPALWISFDWIRSLGFLGYPWGLLGVSQYSAPAVIQIAAWTGVWGVSFLTHFTGAALAVGIERAISTAKTHDRAGSPRTRTVWVPAALAVGLFGFNLVGGALALRSVDLHIENAQKVRIAVIQQNTDPRKHDYRLSLNELKRLSDRVLLTGPVDLIAWPESGFPPDVRYWLQPKFDGRVRRRLVDQLFEWQKTRNVALVTGTQDHYYETDAAGEEVKRIRNSSMFLPKNREGVDDRYYYYKIRLVPFTEHFPYGERFPWIAELLHNFSTTQWTPGTVHGVYDGPGFRFSTPICFEDIFPDHVRLFVVAGADVIVNMSNDYWANTPLEGYQHGAHALFRTVENRRPLVRATCSGWTLIADAGGRVQPGSPAPYEPGWVAGDIALPDPHAPPTLYNRWGDWFPMLMGVLWAAGISVVLVTGIIRRLRRGRAGETTGDPMGTDGPSGPMEDRRKEENHDSGP